MESVDEKELTDVIGQEMEGVLVVSLEQAVAAPYCGLLLTDTGARVVKMERVMGNG